MNKSNRKKPSILVLMIILSSMIVISSLILSDGFTSFNDNFTTKNINENFSTFQIATITTTDENGNLKMDFKPGEMVYIHGSNFIPNSEITLNLTRPDTVIEYAPYYRFTSDSLPFTDQNGEFHFYEYDLDGIQGEYLIQASDTINYAKFIFNDSSIWTTDGYAQQKNEFIVGDVVGLDGEGLTPNSNLSYEIKDEVSNGNVVSSGYITTNSIGEINFTLIWHIPYSYSQNSQHKVYVYDSQTKTKTFSVSSTNCLDFDEDGYYAATPECPYGTDCDDSDPSVYPGATEICDGVDNDCDGVVDEDCENCRDDDGDGFYGITSDCSIGTDCDDSDPSVHPGAPEVCDGIDNDCNDEIDEDCQICFDNDSDGFYGITSDCSIGTDCDDSDPSVHPGAPEVCDGIDNDCNGEIDEGLLKTYYQDKDDDNYGNPERSVEVCQELIGYVTDNTDCDDNDSTIHPGATEIIDGKDNNCNGIIDEVLTVFVDDDANISWYDYNHVRTIQEGVNNVSTGGGDICTRWFVY